MKLEDVFVGKTKDGKKRLLQRKKYFYDIDRFYHIYKDLKTKEEFVSVDIRGVLIPFTKIYDKTENLPKRKVKKLYEREKDRFN